MLNPIQTIRIKLIILTLGVASSSAFAVNIAIIDTDDGGQSVAEQFCNIFENNGHACTAFPTSGPTSSLDPFDVVYDLSELWSDPDKLLVRHLHKGKGVITWGRAPKALGIDTDATVQAWIGANSSTEDFDRLRTVATDPILGNVPVGTEIGNCGDSFCKTVEDTTGHPNAKILAEFQGLEVGSIGILRNTWEGGQSIYLTNGGSLPVEILLRSIDILGNPIPTVSTWGMVVMTLTMLIAGSVVIRKRMTV